MKTIRGLNLAELIISIVIMSLAVITITGMFISGMMGLKKGDNMVIATNMAQSTLELYEKEILCNFDRYTQATYALPDKISNNIKFTRKMVIKDNMFPDTAHSYTNRLKKLTISIYWYEKNMEGKTGNTQKELSFSTYVESYLVLPTPP